MKEKIKIFIAFIIGFLFSTGIVYAATLYSATEVSYDNKNSGTSKTDVQGAVDELYEKAKLTFTLSSNTSEPTDTGKEGEVVIVSDVTPSKYYILNEAPSNPISGSVWLVESSSGTYKASGTDISTAIVAAKQYINSTWVEKPYCIYQNNRWNYFYGFDYTGGVQTFTVPYTGTYTLEVWGAQGGGSLGGYGSYATGTMSLNKNDTLYVVVGGQGPSLSQVTNVGGYNGGGYSGNNPGANSYGGGGATHIATTNRGELFNYSSYTSELLIVAGGGGGATSATTTLAGSGGGYVGNSGTTSNSTYNSSTYLPIGGSQTTGGTGYQGTTRGGSFGRGMSSNTDGWGGGGGAGFYGGGNGHGTTGAGGSGYIGNSLLTNKSMYCYNCSTSCDTATKTYSTTKVNENAIMHYAKKGHGFAKITYIK